MEPNPKQGLTKLLVLTAQTGDEAALRELYGLWQSDLRRLALVRVERADAGDEVLTEVWLDMARGLGRVSAPACFPPWASRIVERRCAELPTPPPPTAATPSEEALRWWAGGHGEITPLFRPRIP